MKKAIKLSLVAGLFGCTMAQAADVVIDGYRGGTLDLMLKGIYVIDDEKNGWAPSNGAGYLVKLKYETPDVWMNGLKAGVGVYVNGDAGLTKWDEPMNKGAGGLVVDFEGASKALMGELYVSYKNEYIDAKFGRQELDTPLTKIQVSLMPNFYEAYMLGANVAEGLRLTAGHITKIAFGSRAAADYGLIGEATTTGGAVVKFLENAGTGQTHESAKFYNIGKAANLADTNGRTVIGATFTGVKNLKADLWAYHSDNIANDYYGELSYNIPVTEDMKVKLNAQYLMQKDTGDSLAGEKDFSMLGAQVALEGKSWGVYAAANKSGDEDSVAAQKGYFNAWGADPAYTSTIFSRNAYRDDVDAYKIGGHYIIMKGLKFMVDYAEYGKSDTIVSTLQATDNAYEIDIALNYKYNENWFFRVFNAKRVSEYNGDLGGGLIERRQDHYRVIAAYTF